MDPLQYIEDARGNLVHISNIKEVDILRHDLVTDLVRKGRKVADQVAAYKAEAYSEIVAFADLSLEKYGRKWGGKKGNITLTSYDGKYRLILARQDNIQFTEQLEAARDLIADCLEEWTADSREEVRTLIDDAFRTNRQGQVSTGNVLRLLRLEIRDPKWETAMQAIKDSIQVAGSAAYIRLYERVGETDKYRQIALDGSSALEGMEDGRQSTGGEA